MIALKVYLSMFTNSRTEDKALNFVGVYAASCVGLQQLWNFLKQFNLFLRGDCFVRDTGRSLVFQLA